MKTCFYLITFLFLTATTSCTDTTQEDDNKAAKNVMTCQINGRKFIASLAGATLETTLSDGTIQLFGMNGDEVVELLLSNTDANSGASIVGEGGVFYDSESFTIVPEKKAVIDIHHRSADHLEGSFSFQAVNDLVAPTKTIIVTNGTFDVTIEK
jgi:hypothetical protein